MQHLEKFQYHFFLSISLSLSFSSATISHAATATCCESIIVFKSFSLKQIQ